MRSRLTTSGSFFQVYRFLTAEVHAYFPPYDTVTIYHCRDVVANKRKLIKCDDVKYINIPYFKGLAIEDMLEWAKAYDNGSAMQALPITEKETLKLPREYIGNILYTQIGDDFQDWVNARIEERNAKVTEDRDLTIEMDPAIARAFKESTAVSSKYQAHSPIAS